MVGEWHTWLTRRIDGFTELEFRPVLLNSDITDDHILISRLHGKWKVTGIIDFGDAMMGHPHYEFIAPLLCFAAGEPQLSRALVESYGESFSASLSDRLLTYCLLHKYAKLSDVRARLAVDRPQELYQAIWGYDPNENGKP